MSRVGAGGAVLLAVALAALLFLATDLAPARASHLCGNTGSPSGPFDLQTYEAKDWQAVYSGTLELAGFNQLFPAISGFALPKLEAGPRSAGSGQLRDPYTPPVLLKAIAWLESTWVQADWSVPYGGVGSVLVSHDCGYGIMQVTSGMQNVSGVPSLAQAMIGGHYGFNIARGARILADKWNLAPEYRPLVGERNVTLLEDWYYAVWGYNGFAFKNHPLNPSYAAWPRVPYSCGPSNDGFGHDRSRYPYQELVLGCVARPPLVSGAQLWGPQKVHLPDLSNPSFAGPLRLENWSSCSLSLQCAPMDMPTPNPSNTDPTTASVPRSEVIGSPSLGVSLGKISLAANPNAKSTVMGLSLSNKGTGLLAWRATRSAPWLKLSKFQGVALGTDIGPVVSGLSVWADASGLPGGAYTGTITLESLSANNVPFEIQVSLEVRDFCFPFGDVTPGHWACSAIRTMYNAGITKGCSLNPPLYCPMDVTSRAQMAAFILKAMRHDDHLPPYSGIFSDVPSGRWYTGLVEHLFEHGISTGYSDGTYGPDLPLSRAELAVLVVRALAEAPLAEPTGTRFSDVSASHWAADYIERLAELGIIAGDSDGTYRPQDAATRAEVAVIIGRGWLQPPAPSPSPTPTPASSTSTPTPTSTPAPMQDIP